MADLSDSELFDSIASGNPAPELQPEPVVTSPSSQPRDDSGRFASQQVETPAQPQQPVVEPQPNAPEPPASNGANVPVGAVQAEREKRQAAQQEAEALRREIAELRGMVQAARQPAPQTPQQEQQPVSLFENPDEYLKSQLTPIQQQMFEQKAGFSRMLASDKHGAEVVDAALQALTEIKGTPEFQLIDGKLMNSIHPFEDLVKWHKQQQSMARVGNDPDAWLNAEIEKRLSDPAFLAQAVERARAGATPAPGNRQTQPVTSIPPSLSRIPAGGNTPPAGDVSDSAMFESVTSRRRG